MSTIVVAARHFDPASVPLARDVCTAGFPLRHQRIDVAIEQVVGAFAGVDRAPFERKSVVFGHTTSPFKVTGFCLGYGCEIVAEQVDFLAKAKEAAEPKASKGRKK